MAEAGNRPYRELVEHHIRKQSTNQLRIASVGELSGLPESLQPKGMSFIDVVNEQLSYDRQFWQTATCREAFERIVAIAFDHFDDDDRLAATSDDPFWLDEEQLGFALLQISTLSFAYSASTQRAQRVHGNPKGNIPVG